MAMPWGMTLWMAKIVWVVLSGWVSSCLTVADDIASSLRTGDIGVLLGKVVVYVFRWMENLLSSPITLFSTGWGEDFLGKRFSILQFRRKFLSLCRFNLFRIKGLREYQVLTVCMCKEVMKSVDHLFPPSGLGSVFYLSLSAWQAKSERTFESLEWLVEHPAITWLALMKYTVLQDQEVEEGYPKVSGKITGGTEPCIRCYDPIDIGHLQYRGFHIVFHSPGSDVLYQNLFLLQKKKCLVHSIISMISVRNTTWSKLYMGPGNPEPSLILVWISKWALELLNCIAKMYYNVIDVLKFGGYEIYLILFRFSSCLLHQQFPVTPSSKA
ncbi:hypothetical protein AAG906_035959 [Vitis piasezkii]|uniref:Uncharacterized protein n=1 Tax=Vitis vinifera TaxID=29760 RepID=A0A438I696_VITVI|nr:hypothetical protein CK203_027152 [Vitis vinifera]